MCPPRTGRHVGLVRGRHVGLVRGRHVGLVRGRHVGLPLWDGLGGVLGIEQPIPYYSIYVLS